MTEERKEEFKQDWITSIPDDSEYGQCLRQTVVFWDVESIPPTETMTPHEQMTLFSKCVYGSKLHSVHIFGKKDFKYIRNLAKFPGVNHFPSTVSSRLKSYADVTNSQLFRTLESLVSDTTSYSDIVVITNNSVFMAPISRLINGYRGRRWHLFCDDVSIGEGRGWTYINKALTIVTAIPVLKSEEPIVLICWDNVYLPVFTDSCKYSDSIAVLKQYASRFGRISRVELFVDTWRKRGEVISTSIRDKHQDVWVYNIKNKENDSKMTRRIIDELTLSRYDHILFVSDCTDNVGLFEEASSRGVKSSLHLVCGSKISMYSTSVWKSVQPLEYLVPKKQKIVSGVEVPHLVEGGEIWAPVRVLGGDERKTA